jgi:hypothetical protein
MADELVLPKEGLPDQLGYIVSAPIVGLLNWNLILWSNDIVPDDDTVYADLVVATFTGFSPVEVTRAGWTTPVIDGSSAVSTWGTTPTTWTCTGGAQTVYGYALVTMISPVIRVIQRFPSPVAVAIGGRIGVLPRYRLQTFVPCP